MGSHPSLLVNYTDLTCHILTFQGVDDVHGGDGLPLCVLGVCDSITDHVLQENLEDSTSFFVDKPRDTLDTTSLSKTG